MIRRFFGKIVNLRKTLEPRLLKIEKRLRFVISTLVLSSVILISTFFFFDKAWLFIPLFIILSFLATYFSILEGIEKIEWFTLFIMPVLFTVSFYLFYFLFPVRWLTRLPFVTIYAISIYAILLSSNIFNVGVEKSLQLYRAAFSVNYFFHSFIMFLASNILFSLRGNFLINGVGAAIVVFPLSFQLFWTLKLKLELDKELLQFSLFTSFILGQIAIMGSFIPFLPSIIALVLTASYYSTTGFIMAHLEDRLFKQTVREYLFVIGFVLVIALLTLD